jgi:hypothetical protein
MTTRSAATPADPRRYASQYAALVKWYHGGLPSRSHRFEPGRPLLLGRLSGAGASVRRQTLSAGRPAHRYSRGPPRSHPHLGSAREVDQRGAHRITGAATLPSFVPRPSRSWYGLFALVACIAGIALVQGDDRGAAAPRTASVDPAIVTTYPVKHPRGLMVTSGGWAYCYQVQKLARRNGYTLLCGRFYKDGYVGFTLRSRRHEDWGNPAYLASFARKISALHVQVGGHLILIGISYSGFGVATLASHHPEIRPSRLIVLDSYLDLVARRARAPDNQRMAKEIDEETGGSQAALQQRSVSVPGLTRLVRNGTRLTMIWSVSAAEKARYHGATCDRSANADTLAALAASLDRPVSAWVTENRHGVDLWRYGRGILAGRNPGREVVFPPDGVIPPGAAC